MHICFSWERLQHLLCEKLYILGLLSIQEAQRLVNNVIRKLKLGSDCVLMIKVNERSESKLRRNTSWERVCISDVTHWGHWSSPQNRNLMISNYLSTDSLSFLVNFSFACSSKSMHARGLHGHLTKSLDSQLPRVLFLWVFLHPPLHST